MPDSFDYTSALDQLSGFLAEQSLPPDVEWVFAEDLAWTGQELKVRAPRPPEDSDVVRSAIESDRGQKLGVEIRAIARTDKATLCGIVIPQDEREAEELMINGLKFSVPSRLLEAAEVSGSIKWKVAKMKHREPSPFAGIAHRA